MLNFAEDNDFEKKNGPLRSNIRDTEQISSNKQGGTEISGVTQNSQAPKTKPTSERKIAANRRNAQSSTGPKDTGSTRFNALKHGGRSQALTPLDDPTEFEQLVRDLTCMYPPQNYLHETWIRGAALEMVRISRNNTMEAYNITLLCSTPEPSNSPNSDKSTKVIHFAVVNEYIGALMDRVQRYSTAGMNRLVRYLRLLEPLRRDESGQGNNDIDVNADGNVII